MKQFITQRLTLNTLLLVMVLAISFVSVFTYGSLYQYAIAYHHENLTTDSKTQAILLHQILQPIAQITQTEEAQKAETSALAHIEKIWFELHQSAPDQIFFLAKKNRQSEEIAFIKSSKSPQQEEWDTSLLEPSMKIALAGHACNTEFTSDDHQIIFSAFTPVVPGEWALAVTQSRNSIITPFKQTAIWTGVAIVLFSLFSWLMINQRIKSAAKRLVSSESRYKQLLESSLDWIWETDLHGTITYSSEQSQLILGYEPQEMVGRPIFDFFMNADANSFEKKLLEKMRLQQAFHNLEIACCHKNGNPIFMLMNGRQFSDFTGKSKGFRGLGRDITILKERQNRIINMAFFDPLTGLPNRAHFLDKLAHHLQQQTPGHTLRPSALIFIDLDGFKQVNDTLGHEAGDQLLKVIAQRMKNHARAEDLVARLAGDEFVILLLNDKANKLVEFKLQLDSYLNRLIQTINEPINIDENMVAVGASIGVALIPKDGKTISEILSHADSAMYQAKELGKNDYQFYELSTQENVEHRLKTSAELKLALQNNEFELYYQLQYDTESHVAVGMEALIRWHHPTTFEIIPASQFIAIAEKTNNIKAIDAWVIEAATRDIAILNRAIPNPPPVSINLSAKQLENPQLPKIIAAAIQNNFIEAKNLRIEVTETSLLHNLKETAKVLEALRTLGIKMSIDDFGTGYSSLAYLKILPVDTLKIDKSFVDNIAVSKHDLQICRAIIQLAESLEMRLIAEGVQSVLQQELLQKEGCHIIQGYVYSRPAPLKTIINKLYHEMHASEPSPTKSN